MQTTYIITSQSGAAGQPPPAPSRGGQSLSGVEDDGNGFVAILSERDDAGADPGSATGIVKDTDTVQAVDPDATAVAPALFGAAFSWPLPAVIASDAAANGAEEPALGKAPSGQGDLPAPGGSQTGVASSGRSGSGVPDLLALGDDLDLAAVAGGLAAMQQDPATPPASAAGQQGNPRQYPGNMEPPLLEAASRSARMETPFQVVLTDLGEGGVQPAASAAALAKGAGATSSSGPGSSGTEGPGQAQGPQPDQGRAMAGVVLSPIEAAQDGALSKAADSLKKAETTTTRPDAPDEILVRRDVPTGAELSRVEQSVQVVLPASAAESLWRGAALARLAGSEDETNDHRDMALPQASSPLADDRAKLVAVGGVDKVVPQVATTTSSVEGVVPGSGSAKVSRREVDPAPSGSGHVVAQSGGASGGPGLQRPQAAIAGTLSVLPPDPTLPVEDEALTDPDLSLSVGFASGSATSVPFSVVGTSVMPHLPATVGHLAGQIAAVVAQTKGGLTEIALSPEELGRVQMTLQADARQPDRMVIFLSFDRPETLELFRRHGDQLAEAMRMAGYSGADISFGQSGTNAGGNSGADPGQAGSAQGNGSLQPLAQSASRTSDTAIGRGDLNAPKHGAGSALDLRL